MSEFGPEDERLEAIYDRLDELDETTFEARAAELLHGLGFSRTMMERKTRDMSGEPAARWQRGAACRQRQRGRGVQAGVAGASRGAGPGRGARQGRAPGLRWAVRAALWRAAATPVR